MSEQDLFIGLMSGTSIDGVDVALVDFTNNNCKLVSSYAHPIDLKLKQKISILSSALSPSLAEKSQSNFNRIELMAQVDSEIAMTFAESVNHFLNNENLKPSQITAIGSHGQTIRHRPNHAFPFTLQIGDANIIAEKTGITTVADFRRADMAAGGQGAPLTPAFHNAILRSDKENRIILNLGGIANITYLPSSKEKPVIGFDTGPANTLLDAWYTNNITSSKGYDENSNFASKGILNTTLLANMMSDSYFSESGPKSTGREYFCINWLEKHISRLNENLKSADIQRTLLELTTQSIADAINRLVNQYPSIKISFLKDLNIYACGGGMHNQSMLDNLSQKLNIKIGRTNDLAVDGDYLEAMTFAWLAKQRLENKPGNLPSVTGSKKEKRLGAIYLP